MVRIEWSVTTLEDVDLILQFIAREAPQTALMFGEQLISSVERLSSFPDSGRLVTEAPAEDIREVIFGNYRIIYKVADQSHISVLRVWHSARLLFPDLFL